MKKKKNNIRAIPENPVIYEINTWVWLRELGEKYRKKINLGNVPAKEYDNLAATGIDTVWLMGVWKRSPAGLEIAKNNEGIMNDLRNALPDLTDDDISGSPYCIMDYQADKKIGGEKGLAKARKELADRGIRLILDFVPNHVAPDHPWTVKNPGFFINGSEQDLAEHPEAFLKAGNHIMARARDPYYPPWPDVLQLNVFNRGLRDELVKTLDHVASQCDGIRCDMAMLVMNDIFSKTWGDKAGPAPGTDFWKHVIPAIRKKHPEFVFIAEVYWDMEAALFNQGFDYCYDKRYYDDLKEGPEKARQHLEGMTLYEGKLLRFLENHDEPRAASLFHPAKNMALALASLTLPGARLFHDGQLEGRSVKVPVFLSRRQKEPINEPLNRFYLLLLKILKYHEVRYGTWAPCELSGWHDNQTCQNMLAWEWTGEYENLIIVVNLSDDPSQAHLKSGYPWLPGKTYQLFDVTSGELYRRDGEEMNDPGLYIILQGWGMHALSIGH